MRRYARFYDSTPTDQWMMTWNCRQQCSKFMQNEQANIKKGNDNEQRRAYWLSGFLLKKPNTNLQLTLLFQTSKPECNDTLDTMHFFSGWWEWMMMIAERSRCQWQAVIEKGVEITMTLLLLLTNCPKNFWTDVKSSNRTTPQLHGN